MPPGGNGGRRIPTYLVERDSRFRVSGGEGSTRDLQYRRQYDIICDVRIVLDTDVIVAALRSPKGASAALLRGVRAGRSTLLVSTPLMLEYEATCQRAEHRLASGLSAEEVERFLDGLAFLAKPVETHFRWRPQLRDPGDEMVLETAVNGGARVLVTFNRRDYRDAPAAFGIEVLIPGDALRRMQG